ncbi:MAG: acyl-CoA dehydrogenase family protein, partial [Myxococcota bacterium]|nr:acyl-CoA dehydrogenase family protein [Myxococcota bacterium]
MSPSVSQEIQAQIVSLVREFVRRDVAPVASKYDDEDIYPTELVEQMKELGLFGITIPEEFGGLGMDTATMALIFEELSKGWMSVSGIIGTHHLLASIIERYGTDDQTRRWLPGMAAGQIRGGLALTEPEAGSDVQNIQTTAVRDGDDYVIN